MFFIRLYSTDARLSWDQFQCILMDIVTLSTDTNDCDLRHQCISEFDLHLCTWAQCCSGNGHNFFGTYSTLLYGQFHSYIFLWPIPALTFGVTYSTDASGPNSKLNFVTYSSTPSRPYSVPPWNAPHFLGNWNGKEISSRFRGCCENALIQGFKTSPHLIVWILNPQPLLWPASGSGLEKGWP